MPEQEGHDVYHDEESGCTLLFLYRGKLYIT